MVDETLQTGDTTRSRSSGSEATRGSLVHHLYRYISSLTPPTFSTLRCAAPIPGASSTPYRQFSLFREAVALTADHEYKLFESERKVEAPRRDPGLLLVSKYASIVAPCLGFSTHFTIRSAKESGLVGSITHRTSHHLPIQLNSRSGFLPITRVTDASPY